MTGKYGIEDIIIELETDDQRRPRAEARKAIEYLQIEDNPNPSRQKYCDVDISEKGRLKDVYSG